MDVIFSCTNSEVRVEGLETLDYLDNLRERERFTEQGDALTFESEVKTLSLFCLNTIKLFESLIRSSCIAKWKSFCVLGNRRKQTLEA